MRRFLLVLPCLLLAFIAALPTRAAVPPGYTPIGPGDVYLATGDSLATGTEAMANNDGLPGYPAALYGLLNAPFPTLQFRNVARSGETSTSFINGGQLAEATQFIAAERAAGRNVGLVTLDIGGNDLVAALRGQAEITDTLTLFRSNFRVILDGLTTALTADGQRTGDLLVMDYYNPYPDRIIGPPFVQPPRQPINTNATVAAFNQIITEEAAARGLPVAEVATAFKGNEPRYVFANLAIFPPTEKSLDFHPRPAGHAAIAREFLAASAYPTSRLYVPLAAQ